jgi:hypothetical protein
VNFELNLLLLGRCPTRATLRRVSIVMPSLCGSGAADVPQIQADLRQMNSWNCEFMIENVVRFSTYFLLNSEFWSCLMYLLLCHASMICWSATGLQVQRLMAAINCAAVTLSQCHVWRWQLPFRAVFESPPLSPRS